MLLWRERVLRLILAAAFLEPKAARLTALPFTLALGAALRGAFLAVILRSDLPIHASRRLVFCCEDRAASRTARFARPYLSRCFFKSSGCRASQRGWFKRAPAGTCTAGKSQYISILYRLYVVKRRDLPRILFVDLRCI